MSRFALALCGAMLVVAPRPIAAQELNWTLGSTTAGLPGEEDEWGEYDLDATPGVELREVRAQDLDLARLRTLPKASLDGFDTTRYPVSVIDAYFDRVRLPRKADDDDADERGRSGATLGLVIRTRSARGTVRWWRLIGDSRHLTIDGTPPVSQATPGAPDDPEGDRLVPATWDPRRPIVFVGYSSSQLFVNSSSNTIHRLVLDFRKAIPRVIGFFDHDFGGGCGGACGVYSCIFNVREEVGCRWDAEHDDFLCAQTFRRRDTAWMERRAARYFHFGGTAGAVTQPSSSYAAGLDPRVAEASTPSVGDTKRVDRFGTISAIELTLVGRKGVILVGAPSMAWHFGARFFAARGAYLAARGPLAEIGSRLDVRAGVFTTNGATSERLEGQSFEEREKFDGLTPDGTPPGFKVSEVAKDEHLTVLRVLVTEGTAKGVYLIGLEFAGDRLVTDAMLVATNGESHLDCNAWRVPATAVGMTVASKPFAATLDVEPARERWDEPHEEGALRGPAMSPCRRRDTVGWEAGQGFRYVSREQDCATTVPRRVMIDDDGGIAAAPVPPRPPL